MNIKEKFLELTSRTYPHGTEKDLFPLLNSELQEDEFGNLFIKISESDVMFTSHLDTATSVMTSVTHVIEDNIIKTDGKSILGADDKAGVVIMLYMIENKIPGLYYFFLGEEVGCVGSKKLSSKHKEEKIEGINKVISFDRRGKNSVITFQAGSRCCSDKFGEALATELNKSDSTFAYKNDPTGVYTDSAQFASIYPECTNISVGYQSEHTFSESQDIEHLDKLAQACLLVNWNSLPVERDPSVKEYSIYGGYDVYDYRWGSDYDWEGSYGQWSGGCYGKSLTIPPPIPKTEKVWFHDIKYNYVSYLEVDVVTKKVITADLCDERINYEHNLIEHLLKSLELDYEYCVWDGFKLKVYYPFDYTTECDRNDLIEYLPELDYREVDEIGGVEYEYSPDYEITD